MQIQYTESNSVNLSQSKIPQSSTTKNIPRINSRMQEEISQKQFENILKRYVSYSGSKSSQTEYGVRGQKINLKKPSKGPAKFINLQSTQKRLKKMMSKTYNYQELKLTQFKQLEQFFKLNKINIKLVNFSDPVILQILRHAIFNRQQIPQSLVNVVSQMAKTNMVKDFQITDFLVNPTLFSVVFEEFQPPLDLYLDFIDAGLIKPSQQQLNEVFTRNQFLFRYLYNQKQLYSTVSQKKRLIYNHFPYLINIFDRIRDKDQACFNETRIKLYIGTIINFLQIQTQDYLLERYLPEVKCLYLKNKSNLNDGDIQYLFLCLKGIVRLSQNQFKRLYRTRPNKTPTLKQHKIKSWKKFEKVEQLCRKVLIRQNFHLNKNQLEQIGQLINYQNCYSEELIKINLVFFILRQEAYNNQQFPQTLINMISRIFVQIPDKKKKKQCCYLLLVQYFKEISETNHQKRGWILRECNFPQKEVDNILDEGRALAIDILLREKQNRLKFQEQRYLGYHEILKQLINETKNKIIKKKAIQFEAKLIKVNATEGQDMKFYEQYLLKNNQFIEFYESETKNGNQISQNCILNILEILTKNNNPSVLRNCILTIQNLIKNHKNGQILPEKFEQMTIRLVLTLYNQNRADQDCQNQILRLLIQLICLEGTYSQIQIITKFFLQIYMKSQANSASNINSSFGIYAIALSFAQKSKTHYSASKQFLDIFCYQAFRMYGDFYKPNSKGSINVLCAIVALGRSDVLLPMELVEQLTQVAIKSRDLAEIALMGVLYQVKNTKSKGVLQSSLINICKSLKDNNNNQIIGVYILQNCFRRSGCLSEVITGKLSQLSQVEKCMNKSCELLCNFYRNCMVIKSQK